MRQLTCIVCPRGCAVAVELNGNTIKKITGNACKRGEEYARNECINPIRTVTSTIRCDDGSVLPVKTDRPIPKSKIMECMSIINRTKIKTPVSIGDILIYDVFGSNIIATANKRNGQQVVSK